MRILAPFLALFLTAASAATAPEVGVETPAGILPGKTILVSVRGHEDGVAPVGSLGDEPLCFWRAASGTYLSFAGLDFDVAPGTRTLTLELWDAAGQHSTWERPLAFPGQVFPESRLHVAQSYATPVPTNEQRAQRDAARLKAIYAFRSPESFVSGNFQKPLTGRVSAGFGERRFFNNVPRAPHTGLDIAAPQGTPVLVPQAGLVVLADELFYSGNTVVLDHGCGLFSYYGHLSRIEVQAGAMVRRGQVLGLVGATGRVTGPHLHWTVRLGPARVDPASLTALDLDSWLRP